MAPKGSVDRKSARAEINIARLRESRLLVGEGPRLLKRKALIGFSHPQRCAQKEKLGCMPWEGRAGQTWEESRYRHPILNWGRGYTKGTQKDSPGAESSRNFCSPEGAARVWAKRIISPIWLKDSFPLGEIRGRFLASKRV